MKFLVGHLHQLRGIFLSVVITAVVIISFYNIPQSATNSYLHVTSEIPLFKKYQQDPRLLGNLKNFQFLIDSAACNSSNDVYMLIIIGSHPSHTALRDVLRKSIVRSSKSTYRIVFPFGLLQNVYDQQLLENESKQHGDIVQGNFIDSYHNVTLRDLMALRWAWQRCSQSTFIIRFDDDIAVDVAKVINVLNECCSTKPVFIGCFVVWQQAPVARTGRYSLSEREHPENIYDDYCNGWMYTMTPQMAFLLDWASFHVQYYWMNDAYITGSLVHYLGITHTQLSIDYADEIEQMKNMIQSQQNISHREYTLGPTGADLNLTKALLSKFLQNI
ncbi:hypothetical protein CHUAL_011828 [Chamberlinius hualienensis]